MADEKEELAADPTQDRAEYDVPFCSKCGSEMETDLSLDRRATVWCCPICEPRME